MQETLEQRCWQCGAAADPSCVYTQTLVSRVNRDTEALGIPVTRSRFGSYVVKVSVPRCAACQLRNYAWQVAIIGGFLIGACSGGLSFPSRGWTTIVGGLLGVAPGLLFAYFHRRRNRLRSLDDFPPLKQLRKAGWQTPG